MSLDDNSRSTDRCTALDASYSLCNACVKEGSKWCMRHNEERIKLYKNYKIHHASLASFPEHTICYERHSIRYCSSLNSLRAWNKGLLTKFQFLTRCIEARALFSKRFFGDDMDFGHKQYWEYLVQQRLELEQLMRETERRAFQLILAEQNALWVLERQNEVSEDDGDCTGHSNAALYSKTSDPELQAEIEDPLDVALRQKRWELWENIKARLARYCSSEDSIHNQERLRVIFACLRRAIYKDPTLMVLAQNYSDVKSLLMDSSLDLPIVERLWNIVKMPNIPDVRAAVDDVLRTKADGEFVTVLGGKVYKDLACAELPLRGWGHIAAIFKCYTCVRSTCKTVEDIVTLTRFAILSRSGLKQSYPKYEFGSEAIRMMTLCGFIPNDLEPPRPRYTVEKCNCSFKQNTAHWMETKRSFGIFAGLSLKDPKSHMFVNACLRHPDFMVMVRKGADGKIIKAPKDIWALRTREAPTRAGLQKVPWDSCQRTIYLADTILQEAQPVIPHARERIQDCLQVVIVDGGEGELEDFNYKLRDVWYEVYRVKNVDELLREISGPYFSSSDLEYMDNWEQGDYPVIPNIEKELSKSYKRLWTSPT